MSAGVDDPRVPVHLLTGFLGSGKTTLLNRLLRSGALDAAAVVVNEFGVIPIDHLLVERSDDRVVELAGGCVCCTVRGDLARTLGELLARRAAGGCPWFERIVIETTGLADPAPVINLLVTDDGLAERLRLGTVVATVDAVSGDDVLGRFPEAVKQVALADHIVVTKRDLAPLACLALELRLHEINRSAPRSWGSEGKLARAAPIFDEAGRARSSPAPLPVVEHRHADGIASFVIERTDPIPGAALALFVESLAGQLGAGLLRVKGLVRLVESADRPAVLHGTQHVFHAVDFLAAWPVPPATRLVFITRGLPPRTVASWVDALLDVLVREAEDTARRLVARRNREESACSI